MDRVEGRRRVLHSRTPGSPVAAIINVFWLLVGALEILLAFRFFLKLLGANPEAVFTQAVYSVSQPFVAPFQAVFGTPAAGGSVLELGTLLAMAVYAVLAWGIAALIDAVVAAAPHSSEREVSELEEEEREEPPR